MIYTKTNISGLTVVDLKAFVDERGLFARLFCSEEFSVYGINFPVTQANLTQNNHKGTLRGLHYQIAPYEEDKLVHVLSGAIFDVAVDLRPQSETYGQHFATILSAENRRAVLIPKGCAHGYQCLADNSSVLYFVSSPYAPEAERGLRWDDPSLAIQWPIVPPGLMSAKDSSWPDFDFREIA